MKLKFGFELTKFGALLLKEDKSDTYMTGVVQIILSLQLTNRGVPPAHVARSLSRGHPVWKPRRNHLVFLSQARRVATVRRSVERGP